MFRCSVPVPSTFEVLSVHIPHSMRSPSSIFFFPFLSSISIVAVGICIARDFYHTSGASMVDRLRSGSNWKRNRTEQQKNKNKNENGEKRERRKKINTLIWFHRSLQSHREMFYFVRTVVVCVAVVFLLVFRMSMTT